jgi:hypothetical protein
MNAIRVAVVVIVAVVVTATHWRVYQAGVSHTEALWNIERAHLAERARSAEADARSAELEMLQAKHEAEKRYEEIRKRHASDAAGARSELERLRRSLAAPTVTARRDPAPTDSPALPAADGGPGIESQLLGQCAEALVGMASIADGLAAKVVGLQTYVTNVCQAKP